MTTETLDLYRSRLADAAGTITRLRDRAVEQERRTREPIAVVGMALRMPAGATTPDEFWSLLRRGVDTTREFPADRGDARAMHHPDPDNPGTAYVIRGGFLDEVDGFDPAVFGISPREAVGMDPQQRIVLELSWEALEHAGFAPTGLAGSRVGVYLGVSTSDYVRMRQESGDIGDVDAYQLIGEPSFIAGRVSYTLGLRGPSSVIDTTCSSSLVAVHEASQALRSGECEMALAGGVNLMLSPYGFVIMSKFRALAADGRCKTFDAAADGYARGEGAGVLVLRRLSDAVADGDTILAVVRGSAVNHDGRSSGLTVPNPEAQQDVIRRALAQAGVAGRDVGYVEAHGTGTSLGDPIELRALDAVMGDGRDATTPLLVGSVKTNVGHLEPAAGIAGLIKVILALEHGEVPPHLNLTTPNPKIPWHRLRIEVPTAARPWPRGQAMIAGVSGFGASGTNAHVVVSAPEDTDLTDDQTRDQRLLLLSAHTSTALRVLAARYAGHLATTGQRLSDICYTSQVGRGRQAHGLGAVGQTRRDLVEHLGAYVRGEETPGIVEVDLAPHKARKTAWLLTGQGSQYMDMARGLRDEPVFAAAFQECADALDPLLGVPLADVVWGGVADLDNTRYAQPALFAVGYAVGRTLLALGARPAALLGHSVGEITAACLAGALDLPDAARLIAVRARLMAELPAGGVMTAVDCDEAAARAAIAGREDRVALAAVNGPNDVVLSGGADDVRAVAAALADAGHRAHELAVSHAFHSPLLEPMVAEFRAELASLKIRRPEIPVISNVTGDFWDAAELEPEYWVRHALSPVRFADGVARLYASGARTFVEVGPQPVLTGLGRKTVDDPSCAWVWLLRRGRDDRAAFLRGLGTLSLRGCPVDWKRLYDRHDGHDGRAPRRVPLPTYPWERQRYWFRPAPPAGAGGASAAGAIAGLGVRLRGPEPAYEQTVEPPEPGEALAWLVERSVRAAGAGLGGRWRRLLDAAVDPALPSDARAPWLVRSTVSAHATRAPGGAVGTDRASGTGGMDGASGTSGAGDASGTDGASGAGSDGAAGGLGDAATVTIGGTHRDSVDAPWSPHGSVTLARSGPPSGATTASTGAAEATAGAGAVEAATAGTEATEATEATWAAGAAGVAGVAGVAGAAEITASADAAEAAAGTASAGGAGGTAATAAGGGAGRSVGVPGADADGLNDAAGAWGRILGAVCAELAGTDEWVDGFAEAFAEAPERVASVVVEDGAAEDGAVTLHDAAGTTVGYIRGLRRSQLPAPPDRRWRPESELLYQLRWTPAEPRRAPAAGRERVLLLGDERELEPVAAGLRAIGAACQVAGLDDAGSGIAGLDGEGLDGAGLDGAGLDGATGDGAGGDDVRGRGAAPAGVWDGEGPTRIVVSALDIPAATALAVDDLTGRLLERERYVTRLVRHLAAPGRSGPPPRIVLLTRGAASTETGHTGAGHNPAAGTLWGLGRVIALEHPDLWGAAVDLDPDGADDPAAIAACVLDTGDEDQWALRGSGRLVARLRPVPPETLPGTRAERPHRPGTVLITGGWGGIGTALAEWLARRGTERLVLAGRTGLPDEAEWDDPELPAAARARVATVRRLRELGAEVVPARLDVTDPEAVGALVARLAADPLPLRGVVHAAGVSGPQDIADIDDDTYRRVWEPKVVGAWLLHEHTRRLDLDLFVCLSSVAATWGSQHLAAYAAGNQFLDGLADHRRALGLPALTVDWGPWGLDSHLFENDVMSFLESVGLRQLRADQGVALLERLLRAPDPGYVVCAVDWPTYKPIMESRGERPVFREIRVESAEPAGGGRDRDVLARLAAFDAPSGGESGEGGEGGEAAARAGRLELLGEYLRAAVAGVLGVDAASVPQDADVFALGLDSLMVMSIVTRCRQGLGLALRPNDFFARTTLGEWAEHLDAVRRDQGAGPAGAGTDAGTDAATDAGTAGRPEERPDDADLAPPESPYQDPAAIAAQAGLPDDVRPIGPPPDGPPRRVLLTGATGFVGAYLLDELLAATDADVVCLVRCPDPAEGLARVRRNVERYLPWRPDADARVTVLPGDLARPRLGLTDHQFARLAADIDDIHHAGAWVDFVHTFEQTRPANIDGTVEILRLACHTRQKRVNHVSTYGIWGLPAGDRVRISESDDIATAGRLVTGYVQTKWGAEHVMRQARERGVPVRVFRPGRVLGDSRSGVCLTTHFTCRVIKGCAQLGLAPDLGDLEIEMTPVDYVARAQVRIAGADTDAGAFHLVNPVKLPFRELVASMRRRGWRLDVVDRWQWWKALRATVDVERNELHPVMDIVREFVVGGEEAVDYDVTDADAALAGSGIACPPLDERLLDTYFGWFTRSGYLPEPPGE